MERILPSWSLKHCRGPESHPRLPLFTSHCSSRVASSRHRVSSTQHGLMISSPFEPRHLCTHPTSCLDCSIWVPQARNPYPFPITSNEKPRLPQTSLTHLWNTHRPSPPDSPSFEPPTVVFLCYCSGLSTACATLMQELLIDLWACIQFIPHTRQEWLQSTYLIMSFSCWKSTKTCPITFKTKCKLLT